MCWSIVVGIMFLLPFAFIALTSLMTNEQALSSHLWPSPFRWGNYIDVFREAPIWRWAINTFIYSFLATLGVLCSSIPVAYALSRLRWRGRDLAFATVLIALMLIGAWVRHYFNLRRQGRTVIAIPVTAALATVAGAGRASSLRRMVLFSRTATWSMARNGLK